MRYPSSASREALFATPTIALNAFSRLRIADSGGLVQSNFIRGGGRRVAGADGVGVAIRRPRDGLEIRGNNINCHRVGLSVIEGISLVIRSNNFEHNRTRVRMDSVDDAKIRGNIFCQNRVSVRIRSGPGLKNVKEFCSAGG